MRKRKNDEFSEGWLSGNRIAAIILASGLLALLGMSGVAIWRWRLEANTRQQVYPYVYPVASPYPTRVSSVTEADTTNIRLPGDTAFVLSTTSGDIIGNTQGDRAQLHSMSLKGSDV